MGSWEENLRRLFQGYSGPGAVISYNPEQNFRQPFSERFEAAYIQATRGIVPNPQTDFQQRASDWARYGKPEYLRRKARGYICSHCGGPKNLDSSGRCKNCAAPF